MQVYDKLCWMCRAYYWKSQREEACDLVAKQNWQHLHIFLHVIWQHNTVVSSQTWSWLYCNWKVFVAVSAVTYGHNMIMYMCISLVICYLHVLFRCHWTKFCTMSSCSGATEQSSVTWVLVQVPLNNVL